MDEVNWTLAADKAGLQVHVGDRAPLPRRVLAPLGERVVPRLHRRAHRPRIHIGSGIFNITPPVNHPARIAERVAVLDHLSEGRFELGMGRGSSTHRAVRLRHRRPRAHPRDVRRGRARSCRGCGPRPTTATTASSSRCRSATCCPSPTPTAPADVGGGRLTGHVQEGRRARHRRAVLHHGHARLARAAHRDLQDRDREVPRTRPAATSTTTSWSRARCCASRIARRVIDTASNMTSGYQNSLVFRYLDTFPKPPGFPTWPDLIPEPSPEDLDASIKAGDVCMGTPEEVAKAVQALPRRRRRPAHVRHAVDDDAGRDRDRVGRELRQVRDPRVRQGPGPLHHARSARLRSPSTADAAAAFPPPSVLARDRAPLAARSRARTREGERIGSPAQEGTMSKKFEGMNAIVTGASRGIGANTALRLAAEGANVAITARTVDKHETLAGSLEETAAKMREHGAKVALIAADLATETTAPASSPRRSTPSAVPSTSSSTTRPRRCTTRCSTTRCAAAASCSRSTCTAPDRSRAGRHPRDARQGPRLDRQRVVGDRATCRGPAVSTPKASRPSSACTARRRPRSTVPPTPSPSSSTAPASASTPSSRAPR